MRNAIKVVVVLLLGLAAGFTICKHWCRQAPPILNADEGSEYEQFESLAEKVKQHLESTEGWMPADLQFELVQQGAVDSVQAFYIGGSVVRVNNYELPARLNTEWELNKKGVLMLLPKSFERWVMYTDGTFSRELPDAHTGVGSLTNLQNEWARDFRRAGYPYWRSLREKRTWLEKNRELIAWSGELKLYVVRQPKQQPIP